MSIKTRLKSLAEKFHKHREPTMGMVESHTALLFMILMSAREFVTAYEVPEEQEEAVLCALLNGAQYYGAQLHVSSRRWLSNHEAVMNTIRAALEQERAQRDKESDHASDI